MTHHPRFSSCWRPAVAVGLVLGLTSAAFAAEAPRPPSSEAVQLSPFLVSTEGDEGYRAANTLSGTRMNASLFHTPAGVGERGRALGFGVGNVLEEAEARRSDLEGRHFKNFG